MVQLRTLTHTHTRHDTPKLKDTKRTTHPTEIYHLNRNISNTANCIPVPSDTVGYLSQQKAVIAQNGTVALASHS